MAIHKPSHLDAGPGHKIPELGAGVGGYIDCPKCEVGVLKVPKFDSKVPRAEEIFVCIECGAEYTRMWLIDNRKIRC